VRTSSRQGVRRARALRRTMSLPEVLLWRALRQRPGGFKFRHQHPAGPYTLDFFCPAAALCIEVDGEAHERGTNPERDLRRDAWLSQRGIKTLRIPAAEILQDLEPVLLLIQAEWASRTPRSSPAFAGEGDYACPERRRRRRRRAQHGGGARTQRAPLAAEEKAQNAPPLYHEQVGSAPHCPAMSGGHGDLFIAGGPPPLPKQGRT